MTYIKNKTLNHIYEKYFIDRKEFKSKEKIGFFERVSLFIPGISFLTSFHINKKIKKEIERAEKESNIKIEEYNNGCCDSDYKKINILTHIIFFLASSRIIFDPVPGILTGTSFILIIFFPIFIFLLGLLANQFSINDLENFINSRNFKKDNVLSKEDMLLLTNNINHDIINDFLVEENFKITYQRLLLLQKKLDEYELKAGDKIKANQILSVLCEEIKQKEVVNV